MPTVKIGCTDLGRSGCSKLDSFVTEIFRTLKFGQSEAARKDQRREFTAISPKSTSVSTPALDGPMPTVLLGHQYDLGMEFSGWASPNGYDSVVFRGDVAAREFLAFWVKDGRLLAGMNVNVWDVHDDIRALITAGFSGKSVDLSMLTDPHVTLTELLA